MRSERTLARAGLFALTVALLVGCEDGENPVDTTPDSDVLSGNITESTRLTNDREWVLSGFVKVTNGATLTIEPGTRIVGDTTVAGSSLWITRGARIQAEGTAEAPIVFTSQRSRGNRRPGDWGGIVIVGIGTINRAAAGIQTEGPEPEVYSGGSNNDDSSGSLRYVRIEFAGYDLTGSGQELNSLSMYAVGRGTRIEYIQSLAGLDDSFEWWGGAVDARYLVSVESGDDHFDASEGYQGRNQFLIAYQSTLLDPRPGTGSRSGDPRGFEIDGCEADKVGCSADYLSSTPLTNPVFANFTLIGSQDAAFPSDGNAIVLRRGAAGAYYNGIVARYKGTGLQIRNDASEQNRAAGTLDVRSLLFVENAANFDADGKDAVEKEGARRFAQRVKFAGNNMRELTMTAASLFGGLGSSPDFAPVAGSDAASGASNVPAERVAGFPYQGGWQNTSYVGAVAPAGPRWYQGWTSFETD